MTVTEKLAFIADRHNLTDGACADIGSLLRELGAEVPKDARTIRKRCRKKPDKDNFHHFGLVDAIMEQVRKGLIGAEDVIKLIINMDGIPLSDNSLLTLWPILGMVVNGIGSLLLFKFVIRANIVKIFSKVLTRVHLILVHMWSG